MTEMYPVQFWRLEVRARDASMGCGQGGPSFWFVSCLLCPHAAGSGAVGWEVKGMSRHSHVSFWEGTSSTLLA